MDRRSTPAYAVAAAAPPAQITVENYAIGLANEEAGEIVQEVGKAMRFGLDTKSPMDGRYAGTTPRERWANEMADMQAAIWFALDIGLLDPAALDARAKDKLNRHHDPDFRRLAWKPPVGS